MVSNMFSKIKKYVIGFFVLCGGILVAFLSGKGAGRKEEKIDKLDERLKRIINDEEERREESADYFGRYQEVFEDALHEADAREKQGFENQFEFAVFGKIQEIIKSSDKSKEISKLIYE